MLSSRDVVEFGAAGGALTLRAHEADGFPAVAGRLLALDDRVLVEAGSPGDGASPQRAIEITEPYGPAIPLSVGSVHSPRAPRFAITVRGAATSWTLIVEHRAPVAPRHGTPLVVDLTEDERRVLLAYAAPVLAGGVMPASHDDVGKAVHHSRSQVRRILAAIDHHFAELNLWMPRTRDQRVRVVEAARWNLVTWPDPPSES